MMYSFASGTNAISLETNCLECEEEEECHHEAEKTHRLREGKSQDGVGEQLLLKGGVPGITNDERSENGANSSSRTSDTNCSSTGADELGSGVNVGLGCRGGEQLGGLDGSRANAPDGSEGEAGGEGETGNGGHSAADERSSLL